MPMLLSPPFGAAPTAYWRLYFLGAEQGVVSISELKMSVLPGGADIVAGATSITANYNPGGSQAPGAIRDGSTGTTSYWYSNTALGAWLQFQFASPVSDIGEIIMTARNDSLWCRQAPTAFLIQKSYDSGSTWTTVSIVRGIGTWTQTLQRTLTPASFTPGTGKASAIAWLIDVTATQGTTTAVSLAEMAFATSAGGANLCTGGGPFHNMDGYVSGAFPPYKAFDGTLTGDSNTYISAGSVLGKFGYIFGTNPSVPTHLRLTARAQFFTGDSPANFTIKYTCDGLTYTTTDTITGQSFSLGETKTYSIT